LPGVAHVQGGAQWRDLDEPAFQHGLAVPGGVFGDTGVGGLTLGGGVGFLMGNFGAVTRFDLGLHAIGPMYGGAVAVPLGDGAAIRRYSALMRDAPDELLAMIVLGRDDDGSTLLYLQFAYVGDAGTGEQFARLILGDGWPGGGDLRTCSYLDIQSINEIEPFGSRNDWSSTFVTDLGTTR